MTDPYDNIQSSLDQRKPGLIPDYFSSFIIQFNMTTQQVADRLVDLLRAGNFNAVYDELFHPTEVVHDEPQSPYFAHVVGVEAIKAKDEQMQSGIAEFLGMNVGEPAVSRDYFALPYQMKFKLKDGTVVDLDEIIVYEVRDGKIVLEKFFY